MVNGKFKELAIERFTDQTNQAIHLYTTGQIDLKRFLFEVSDIDLRYCIVLG